MPQSASGRNEKYGGNNGESAENAENIDKKCTDLCKKTIDNDGAVVYYNYKLITNWGRNYYVAFTIWEQK